MRYIFLDTNNWIYLSNGFNILNNKLEEVHFRAFDLIKKRVEDQSLVILTNQIILEEWERNKQQSKKQIEEIRNRLDAYTTVLRNIKRTLPDESTNVDTVMSKLADAFNAKINTHEKHIEDVEVFLKTKTIQIKVSNKVRVKATHLATDKKAPFIGDKKNSTADALILLSSIEYIEKHCQLRPFGPKSKTVFYPENYFVSSNSGDFSSVEDKDLIHKDLEPLLRKTETQYFRSLSRLIESLEAEFLSEEEANMMDNMNANCPVCNFPYANTVEFSASYKIYDPNKDPRKSHSELRNSNQAVVLDKEEMESEITQGNCTHCDGEFFVCPNCQEMNHIPYHNKVFECEFECGYSYIVNTEVDKKGMLESWDLEIVCGKECQRCNEVFCTISDSGLCFKCEEHYGTNQ